MDKVAAGWGKGMGPTVEAGEVGGAGGVLAGTRVLTGAAGLLQAAKTKLITIVALTMCFKSLFILFLS